MDPNKASFIKKVEGIDGISAPQKARAKQLADFFLCSRDNDAEQAFDLFQIFNQYIDEPYLDQINPSFDDEDLARMIDQMIIFPLETTIDGLPALYIDLSQINLSEIDICTLCQVFVLNLLALATKHNLHKKDQNMYILVIDCSQAGYSNWYKEIFQHIYFISLDCFPAQLETIYFVGAPFFTKMFLYYANHTSDFKEDLNELTVFLADETEIVERATDANKLIYELGGNAQQNQMWVGELKSKTKTILFGNVANRSNLDISQASRPMNRQRKSVTFGQEILATEKQSQQNFSRDFRSSFGSSGVASNKPYEPEMTAPATQNNNANQPDPSGDYEILDNQQAPSQPTHQQVQNQTQPDPSADYEILDNQGAVNVTSRRPNRRSTLNLVSNADSDRYDCLGGMERVEWLQGLVDDPNKTVKEFESLNNEYPYRVDLCRVSERWKESIHRNKLMFAIQDSTRVVLQGTNDADGYINASFIDGYHHPKKFIIAESPQDITLENFLLMIWQQQIEYVIDLVGVKEKKCSRYFPSQLNGQMNVGFFTLTCTDIRIEKQTLSFTKVSIKKEDEGIERLFTILTLSRTDYFSAQARIPGSTLLDQLNNQMKALKTDHPILLHDSSGNRLPGVMAAMNICKTMTEIKKHEARIDLMKLVVELRKQRYGLILAHDDYQVLYRSIVGSICRRLPGMTVDIKENLRRLHFIA